MKKIPLSPQVSSLISKLKEIGFANQLIDYINKRIPQGYQSAKEFGLSINDYISELEDDSGQWTVVFTNFISYYCVKEYLAYHANSFLLDKTSGTVRILNKNQYLNHHGYEMYKGLAFDIVFEVDGVLVPLEIKVTQGGSGFSGATHSTSKVTDYLLISLDIDRDVIVNDGVGFVKSAFICITSITKESWMGEASGNNSFTSFKFKVNDSDGEQIDYSDGFILGSLKKNRVWYGIEGEVFQSVNS